MSRPMRIAKQFSLALFSGGLTMLAAFAGTAVSTAQAEPAKTVAYGQVADPSPAPDRVRLASGHPEQYVVKRGDTLWDISSVFLQDPWFWPEIWYVNEQIENPHLIFPGDILNLIWMEGRPRIMVDRGVEVDTGVSRGDAIKVSPQIRYESLDDAITAIPYASIKAFLSKPSVLSKKQARNLPYILSSRDNHLVSGSGNTVYARGFKSSPRIGEVFNVIHIGDEIRDPDDHKVIGYDGIYSGEAKATRLGDPTSLVLVSTTREVLNGDRLLRDNQHVPLNFFPSAPARPIEGRIISILNAITVTGSNQVVVINRGTRHGLEVGNILTILHKGESVRDRFSGGLFARKVSLPDEPAGKMMVFMVYDRISYGLIVNATREIKKLDLVRNP